MVSHADKAILHPMSPGEWQQWIESDTTGEGVRLRLRKKAATQPGITYAEALDVALCYGWIDGQKQSDDADFFLQAFTPRRPRSMWSKVNREHVERLVAEGRMRAGGQAEVDRAKADGRWDAAYRQRDATVPADLTAALAANPAAAAAFGRLSRQERFSIVFRLGNVKLPATRERRIASIIDTLT
jgi:uncharacterized protein YdeI (YjbR/CyaY-like superfamily)